VCSKGIVQGGIGSRHELNTAQPNQMEINGSGYHCEQFTVQNNPTKQHLSQTFLIEYNKVTIQNIFSQRCINYKWKNHKKIELIDIYEVT